MEIKFRVGAKVRGRSNTNDAGKTGIIVEKGIWVNSRGKPTKPPVGIWFVLWNGETNKQLKNEDELEIIE